MAGRRGGLSLLWQSFVMGQKIKLFVAAALEGAPMRADEYAVYSALAVNGPMSPTELARTLGMPPTTMSHYVRSMLERGHATRLAAPADARSFRLDLTEAGMRAHDDTSDIFSRANATFEALLGRREARLTDALREIGDTVELAAEQVAAEARRAAS